MELCERLRQLRQSAKYSQEQLAEMLQVSRQAISKWESGQATPEIFNIIKLAKIYGVSTDAILLGLEANGVICKEEIKYRREAIINKACRIAYLLVMLWQVILSFVLMIAFRVLNIVYSPSIAALIFGNILIT